MASGRGTLSTTELWRKRLTVPAYRVGEAASYARVSPQTVASWHQPKNRGSVVSRRAPRSGLSFVQLIEVAVVAAMRKEGVKLSDIRKTREFFSERMGLEYPFAQAAFKTDGVDILLDDEDRGDLRRLVAANDSGQKIWADATDNRLLEFNYEPDGPVKKWKVNGQKSEIEIDPTMTFGTPQVGGVPTWILKERWRSGEGLGDISDDFSIPAPSIVEPLRSKVWRSITDGQTSGLAHFLLR